MSEFLKLGDIIVIKPKGADYSLEAGKVYDLNFSRFEGPRLKENGELNLPPKVYKSKKDEIFIKRILDYHHNSKANTTGVMMAGTKGTGKSIMAKVIAKESNLPIIIVSPDFPASQLTTYFKQFTQEVCIIFDEVEKNYNTEMMLSFLDGIEKTCRKLVLMTCNEISCVSQYMTDRCSRVRYLRKYSENSNIEFLPMIVEDLQIKNPEKVIEFCKNEIKLLSMDNIFAFLQEVKAYEGVIDDLGEIISIMNISTKTSFDINGEKTETKSEETKETVTKKDCSECLNDYLDDYDDFDGYDDYCEAA